MSLTPSEENTDDGSDDDEPNVPEGVLRGIEDIEAEDTASKDDLESLLNF